MDAVFDQDMLVMNPPNSSQVIGNHDEKNLDRLAHQREIVISILEYLELKDIGMNCRLVCKEWNLMINDTQPLWRSICINELKWPIHISNDELLFQMDMEAKINAGEIDALSSPLPQTTKENINKSNGRRAISICGKSFAWRDFCYMLHLPASLYFFSNSTTNKHDCAELYYDITGENYTYFDAEFPDNKFNVIEDGKLIDCLKTELAILKKQKVLTHIQCDRLYERFIPILNKLRPEPLIDQESQTQLLINKELVLGKNKYCFHFNKVNYAKMEEVIRESYKTTNSYFGLYLLNDDTHSFEEVTGQLKAAFKNNIDFEFCHSIMIRAHCMDESILFESTNLDLCLETVKTLAAIDLHVLLTVCDFDALQTIRRRFATNSENLEFYVEFKPEKLAVNFEKALANSTEEDTFVVSLHRSNHQVAHILTALQNALPQLEPEDCIGIYFTVMAYGNCYVAAGSFERCKEVASNLNQFSLNVTIRTEKQAKEDSERLELEANTEDDQMEDDE